MAVREPSSRAKAFKRFLKSRNLRTKGVAISAGVPYTTVASFVQGWTQGLRGEAEQKLARALEASVEEVFGTDEEPASPHERPATVQAIDRDSLRRLIVKSGRAARAISRSAGLGDTAIRDILSGLTKSPRIDTLQLIARELKVDIQDFANLRPMRVANKVKIVPEFLSIRYRVAAGRWAEVEFEQPPIEATVAVVPHPKYANWPQWLELVEGDSVNLKIPDGHYAHVVDAIEMGYAAQPDDWVVVERRRDDGRSRERTIKQIEILPGGLVALRARSTNPIWAEQTTLALRNGEPVTVGGEPLPDGEKVEVEIVGLVIGAYNPDF